MLTEEVRYFNKLFDNLSNTTSLTIKRYYIKQIPAEYANDWTFILEILAGKRKIGYTIPDYLHNVGSIEPRCQTWTLRQYMAVLWEPIRSNNLSQLYIEQCILKVIPIVEFVRPIVNRTLRLGIGLSLLDKPITSPMLANKYDGLIKVESRTGYYITEKLDGNRCIAQYDYLDDTWKFYTRNGKLKNYNIQMGNLPKDVIYDGEMLNQSQTDDSCRLELYMKFNGEKFKYNKQFNEVSGQLNRKSPDMKFVYNIFDIISDDTYTERRKFLDTLTPNLLEAYDVRILPVLKHYDTRRELYDYCDTLLDDVVDIGAEGLMINAGDSKYENRRTNCLLKYKKQKTIDMAVIGIKEGTSKYEGCVGALACEAYILDDVIPKYIYCDVGSGLSDYQRQRWYDVPEEIMHKIVEVAYFDISQGQLAKGSNTYSLRFPRLKSVRKDKDDNINPM